MKLYRFSNIRTSQNTIYLVKDISFLDQIPLSDKEREYILHQNKQNNTNSFRFNRLGFFELIEIVGEDSSYADMEKLRKKGDSVIAFLMAEKQSSVVLKAPEMELPSIMAFLEGMILGGYTFLPYKSIDEKIRDSHFDEIFVDSVFFTDQHLKNLSNLMEAVFLTRDLVNEPPNKLDATLFSQKMADYGRNAGTWVEIFGKEKITELGMEGLLTVNQGSKTDPNFTVIEWKPNVASNKQPIVLVGKGLVYDTGGINLKPGSGLDAMKSDMAGGAAVFGTLYALAMNKIPLHVIGLIPVTDNRPGENAMVPGDVISMGNGKTVEIINTDAEGRLVLADALIYARRYDPKLVIDIATLTGAAVAALGRYAIAGMQQDADSYMKKLVESSMRVYERVVELPFWDEYGKDIESDIADIRNLGKGKGAGTISAGKFLSHFIEFPWIHLDIATMAFMDARESYMGKGATGAGVRLLYDFLERESVVG
jgi:leucyl aminopeptidase